MFRASTNWALCILLVAAAGCGIDSYNSFRDQLATRSCERQIRCGEVGGTESQNRCSVPAPLLLTIRGSVDVPSSIAAHRMIFHPDNATECLDAVKRAPCDARQAADDFLRHCHGVVTAGVNTGGTCWGDDECVGGVCIAPDCGGVCTAFAAPGAACVPTGGTPDVTCDASVHFCAGNGTCEHRQQQGAACTADEQCIFAFVCAAGKCDDPPRVQRDNVCGTNMPPCEDGLYCSETGVCASLLSAGQPCAKPDACQAGMVCTGGICAPWLDVGSPCSAGGGAVTSGCPSTQSCAAGACAPVAGVKAGPLAHCGNDGDCADGLYCSTSGSYCFYAGGVNAVCQSDHECAKDLQCVGGACHTPGYIMCAAPSM
ncbi:MAG: hypothetical protein JWM53_6226 [bacterium]|nr:hypothetical protein [bacterium]